MTPKEQYEAAGGGGTSYTPEQMTQRLVLDRLESIEAKLDKLLGNTTYAGGAAGSAGISATQDIP